MIIYNFPIPRKLVKKIELGQFIDIVELLPDCLSTANAMRDTDAPASNRADPIHHQAGSKLRDIYGHPVKTQPHRGVDSLGYHTLTLQAYQESWGNIWLRYDRTTNTQGQTINNRVLIISNS